MEKNMEENILVFQQYPFKTGDKIHIADGRRKGDWLVVGIDDNKITLRCPISQREFSWNRFCYAVDSKKQPWPTDDSNS